MNKQSIASHILQTAAQTKQRYIVAVAGAPASGKSTLAEQLEQVINQQQGEAISMVVPMDGFHLDNHTLDEMNLRHRKGAPETFDSKGFVNLIQQLKTASDTVAIPLFDREQDAVIPKARNVDPRHKILLVEGNYLLLDIAPWLELAGLFDDKIFLNPGLEVLEQRLIQRWLDHGYDTAGARERALSNDIPNARFVLEHSVIDEQTQVLT
ncbi:MAG: phosphoribulokinase [Thiolinea sp.]